MPERRDDHRGVWQYQTGYPGADLKANPVAISMPKMVESIGVDGRFIGSIRPFPGMADVTVHGVPTPSGSTTVTSLNNIIFAKYASIKKGFTGETLKGIVYIADNPAADNQAVYFAYRDSSDGSTDVVMLEDFESWTDFKIDTLIDYDITSSDKYIYLCASADTSSTVSHYDGEQPPYNKAYFWDFRINGWDDFDSGFKGRFAGLMPQRLLGTPLNTVDDGTYGRDSSAALSNGSHGYTDFVIPEGIYTYAAELVSRKHGLRSYIRWHTAHRIGSSSVSIRWVVSSVKSPRAGGGATNQIKANVSENSALIDWGIPHVDGIRLWRSPANDRVEPNADNYDVYSLMGGLYLVSPYEEKGQIETGSSGLTLEITHGNDVGNTGADIDTAFISDSGLLEQLKYDVYHDEVGAMPRSKRLLAYDGTLLAISDIREPDAPTQKWKTGDQAHESIHWGSLSTSEKENFPASNVYKPDDPSEVFYALEPVGDHAFAISNQGIYKVSRSGGTMGINRIQYRLGGVSRYGQTSIGNTLFVITPSGLKQVNANNGQVSSVTAFDRIILDDSEWASTLTDIHLEYDALIGALIMLNTSTKEAYLLWESTGAVTKIEDIPWSFLVSGPDVETDGPQRAYFITSTGAVHVIDGARAMGKRSMCGTSGSETVNGTATSGSDATTLVDSTATFPANCPGFKVHILSGDRANESATISTRDSDTQLTISGLSGTLSVGDRYSISPVVTRITMPQVVSQGGQVDHFVRKTVTSMSAAFSDLGGETGGSDPNNKFNFGMKKGTSILGRNEVDINGTADATATRVNYAGLELFPFVEFKGGNMDFELKSVMVKGILGVSEAESRQT